MQANTRHSPSPHLALGLRVLRQHPLVLLVPPLQVRHLHTHTQTQAGATRSLEHERSKWRQQRPAETCSRLHSRPHLATWQPRRCCRVLRCSPTCPHQPLCNLQAAPPRPPASRDPSAAGPAPPGPPSPWPAGPPCPAQEKGAQGALVGSEASAARWSHRATKRPASIATALASSCSPALPAPPHKQSRLPTPTTPDTRQPPPHHLGVPPSKPTNPLQTEQ